jgi:hypothetical protein
MKKITKTFRFAVLLVLVLAPVAVRADATRWSAFVERAKSVPPAPAVTNSVRYSDKPAERQVPLKQLELPAVRSLRLLTHANVPLKVVMGLIPRTLDEVQEMLAVVKRINEEEKLPADERLKLHLVCDSHATFRKLKVSQDDFDRYVEVNRFFHMTRSDVWMQDWGEIAVVDTPAENKEQLLLLDTNRGRDSLAELPASLARLWSGYFVKKPTASTYSSGDYGGNIEVTPDGVLMLGTTSSQELRDILAVGYKDRTAILDTDWLQVGHVDEYLTTIPTPKAPRGYAILKADPTMGLACIAKLPKEELDREMESMVQALLKNYREQPEGVFDTKEQTQSLRVFATLYAYHAQVNGYAADLAAIGPVDAATITAAVPQLIEANRKIQETIDAQVATLVETIKRTSGDATTEVTVIPLPAVFEPFNASGKSIAMLPGCANLVVLRNHIVVPDPLLPCLRADVQRTLESLSLKPTFIPDASYHFWQGQLHCGTNVLRHPNKWLLDPERRPLRTKQFRDLLAP